MTQIEFNLPLPVGENDYDPHKTITRYFSNIPVVGQNVALELQQKSWWFYFVVEEVTWHCPAQDRPRSAPPPWVEIRLRHPE